MKTALGGDALVDRLQCRQPPAFEAESVEMKPRSSALRNPCINLLESLHNAPMPKPVGPQQGIDDGRKTSSGIGIMDKVPAHIPTIQASTHRIP